MGVYEMGNSAVVPIVGILHGMSSGGFNEKEVLAAIIAVEDILDMEGFSLVEALDVYEEATAEVDESLLELTSTDSGMRQVFQLYDNSREFEGDIWNAAFLTLRDVIERLERYHEEKLLADYDEYEENGLEAPDPMVEKALILIENHTYIRDLLGSIDADTRCAMKDKYYGIEGSENIKRAEALFRFGPSDDYVGINSAGKLDIDALGYLADRLIAAKIMETQSAYEVIEYNGQLCEVYVDNGDISDFKEEIENGTLLECEGVCPFESYRDYIDGQVGMILDDFNDIGLYEADGSWGFYLTEKELVHIGLGEQLEKEKQEYENVKDVLVVGEHAFELVDELPLGYQFWNRNMPDGYLPMCRMAAVQPFEGARNIEVDTLKAVRLEGAQAVLRASIRGYGTVDEMMQFVADCQDAVKRGKTLSPAKQEDFERVKAALEALKPLLTKPMTLDERLGKAVAQSEEEDIWTMREFLKKHDPHFATDEYLDALSLPALREYYRECRQAVKESYRDAGDDWAQRRERLATDNLGFHG